MQTISFFSKRQILLREISIMQQLCNYQIKILVFAPFLLDDDDPNKFYESLNNDNDKLEEFINQNVRMNII